MQWLLADTVNAKAQTTITSGMIAIAGLLRTVLAMLFRSDRYGMRERREDHQQDATPATIARVPNQVISAKPVRKTPKMLPAEAAA